MSDRYTSTRVLLFADEFWLIETANTRGGILLQLSFCGEHGEVTPLGAATCGYGAIVDGFVMREGESIAREKVTVAVILAATLITFAVGLAVSALDKIARTLDVIAGELRNRR